MPLACVRYSTKHAAEWSEGQAPKAARRDTPTDRAPSISRAPCEAYLIISSWVAPCRAVAARPTVESRHRRDRFYKTSAGGHFLLGA